MSIKIYLIKKKESTRLKIRCTKTNTSPKKTGHTRTTQRTRENKQGGTTSRSRNRKILYIPDIELVNNQNTCSWSFRDDSTPRRLEHLTRSDWWKFCLLTRSDWLLSVSFVLYSGPTVSPVVMCRCVREMWLYDPLLQSVSPTTVQSNSVVDNNS